MHSSEKSCVPFGSAPTTMIVPRGSSSLKLVFGVDGWLKRLWQADEVLRATGPPAARAVGEVREA